MLSRHDLMIIYPPPIIDRKIRVALVGCGRIAKNHFGAKEKHAQRAELVAVCDVNKSALDAAAAATGAKAHSSLPALLKNTNADVVVLSTPSGLHPEQAIQVAESGRHVMT